MIGLALVIMVAALGVGPEWLTGRSAVVIAPRAEVPGVARIADESATTTTSTSVAAASSTLPVRTTGPATVVPDARPGDLRVDANADVLPAGFVAAAPADVRRDLEYGPGDTQLLDLYLPEEANAPVIVFLHSGGWIGGDRSVVPEMVLRHVERGYAVASVEYRLAPDDPFPAPIHDVKQAVRELKVIGAETGLVDGDAIVLYGTSAGGHIAAFAAATAGTFEPPEPTDAQTRHDSSVAGIVVAVGPTDLVQLYSHPNVWARPMTGAHAGCEPCTLAELELPSPINHLHGGLPPAYWMYGELDPLVDAELQGRVMADAWARAAGTEFSWFDLVEGVDHNLDETVVNERAVEAFLDHVVGR